MEDNKRVLRLGTYMCPSIPVGYYECLAEYLEAELGVRTMLIYDSRRPGPDITRGDDQRVDVAFVSTATYVEKFRGRDCKYSLLPASAVLAHPVKGEVHGYFTDVVIHRDVRERLKEFLDLRGCQYGYARDNSLSSARQMLLTLKQMGENASFFAGVQASGDHTSSIELLISKRVEAAAVDSMSLLNYLGRHYYHEEELHVQESWGPLPPHPILATNQMPIEMKQMVTGALLHMHESAHWSRQLRTFGVVRFAKSSPDTYLPALELMHNTKSLSLGVTYY